MAEKISVIIPVYNVKKYLRKCVESVTSQTYKNLEILLVDDGSTDGSGEMCRKLAESDKRILVIHKENGGLSDARNVGMDAATGDFIAFVDSDDWIDPDMYEVLYRLLKDYQADIAVCRFKNVYRNRIEDGSTDQLAVYDNLSALKAIAKIENNFYPTHNVWNKLYKKELLSEIRFIKGKLVEDLYFTPYVIYESNRCVYIDSAKYNYLRERPDSIMNGPLNIKRIMDELTGYDEFAQFLLEIGLEQHAAVMKETYLRKLMEFHYEIKVSHLENKQQHLQTLENKFYDTPYKKLKSSMSMGIKLKLLLFEISPSFSDDVRKAYKSMPGRKKRGFQRPAAW